MNLPLSKRLQVCCDFVAPGDRVADIGCDHGYLAIHLLLEGLASSVIAADINKMPLETAVRNAAKFGVQDNITFCLSDGAKSIPRDFNTLVCAGMGADTMISILTAAPWLRSSQYRLILQCQSKTAFLRQYLSENGWRIKEERVLRDGRFLYTVMNVLWDPEYSPLTIGQTHIPPALLENISNEVASYYHNVITRLQRAVNGQKENADPNLITALNELENMANSHNWLKEAHR